MDNSVIQRNRVSDLINNEISFKKKKHHSFGDMSENRFWLLIEISPIHSEKVIAALKDILCWATQGGKHVSAMEWRLDIFH